MPKDLKRSPQAVWPAIVVFLALLFWLSKATPNPPVMAGADTPEETALKAE